MGRDLFAYMIIDATLLSANAYLIGIKYVGEAKASLISCAEPLVSIVCVVAIFGVKFSIIDFIGMACIIFTVMLLASNKKT